jgi:hypothetical protein
MPEYTDDQLIRFVNAERRMAARGRRYQHRVRRRVTFLAILALAFVLLYLGSR